MASAKAKWPPGVVNIHDLPNYIFKMADVAK